MGLPVQQHKHQFNTGCTFSKYLSPQGTISPSREEPFRQFPPVPKHRCQAVQRAQAVPGSVETALKGQVMGEWLEMSGSACPWGHNFLTAACRQDWFFQTSLQRDKVTVQLSPIVWLTPSRRFIGLAKSKGILFTWVITHHTFKNLTFWFVNVPYFNL